MQKEGVRERGQGKEREEAREGGRARAGGGITYHDDWWRKATKASVYVWW
jgi:hypothetical protein